jgi:hypothetical protein
MVKVSHKVLKKILKCLNMNYEIPDNTFIVWLLFIYCFDHFLSRLFQQL